MQFIKITLFVHYFYVLLYMFDNIDNRMTYVLAVIVDSFFLFYFYLHSG